MPIMFPTPAEFSDLPLQTRLRVVATAHRVLDDYGHPAWPIPIPQPPASVRWTSQHGETVREEARRVANVLGVDPEWQQHQAVLEEIR